jgi:hypothetical protein
MRKRQLKIRRRILKDIEDDDVDKKNLFNSSTEYVKKTGRC